MIDYQNSIVLVGTVGAGKSLVGRALSRRLHIDIITADEFRHLPTMLEIDKVLAEPDLSARRKDEFERYRYLRNKYPNIRNYSQFGFKSEVSQYLEKHFGKVAWHYYQKQFENLLIQDICDKISGAIILDTGGGMPVSLDEDYSKLREKFESLDKDLFYREFSRLDMIGKSVTYDIYHRFDNVIYLKLSDEVLERSDRAQDDGIGSKFVESKDYEQVSNMVIDTTGLYVHGRPNENGLNSVVDTIVENINNNEFWGE